MSEAHHTEVSRGDADDRLLRVVEVPQRELFSRENHHQVVLDICAEDGSRGGERGEDSAGEREKEGTGKF